MNVVRSASRAFLCLLAVALTACEPNEGAPTTETPATVEIGTVGSVEDLFHALDEAGLGCTGKVHVSKPGRYLFKGIEAEPGFCAPFAGDDVGIDVAVFEDAATLDRFLSLVRSYNETEINGVIGANWVIGSTNETARAIGERVRDAAVSEIEVSVPKPEIVVAGVALYPSPREVTSRCEAGQAKTSFRLLCPTLLPRPSLPLGAGAPIPRFIARAFVNDHAFFAVDVSYGAPDERVPARNRLVRFLHFTVNREEAQEVAGPPPRDAGPPPRAVEHEVGGREGLLLPADGRGAWFGNHVRFFFEEAGERYVVTLHDIGPATLELLDALVENLRPVAH